jgi:hypothetical protein
VAAQHVELGVRDAGLDQGEDVLDEMKDRVDVRRMLVASQEDEVAPAVERFAPATTSMDQP